MELFGWNSELDLDEKAFAIHHIAESPDYENGESIDQYQVVFASGFSQAVDEFFCKMWAWRNFSKRM